MTAGPRPPVTAGRRALVTAELLADDVDRIGAHGYEVRVAGWGATRQALDGKELLAALDGVTVLVCEVESIDAAVLAACPALRLVAACRAAPTNVDVPAATAAGVLVTNAPGRNAESVADHSLAVLLDALRDITRSDRHLRQVGWHVGGDIPYFHFRGPELSRTTVGLLGFGAVGRAVARRLVGGFGCTVLVHDPHVTDSDGLERVGVDELFERSNAVSLHAPLTADTRGVVDARRLLALGSDGVLVNTARAGLVDTDALVSALQVGTIRAAAIDVHDTEPLPREHPLLSLDNVVLTPHIAGAGSDVPRHHGAMVVADVTAFTEGRRPARLVNPEAWRP